MKIEFVGKAKTVLFRSSASLLGMAATVLGVIGELGPQVGLLQGTVSPQVFAILSIICAAAVPVARIIKQDQLRLATAAANPQPTEAVNGSDHS
jgi:hypothetical protein